MDKKYAIYAVLFAIMFSHAQEVALPTDLRQHNITEFNSSLFNPVFSLDRNNPESIAWWSRYQWQTIDGDPTSMFLNYSRKINTQSSIGVGFIQNNTGVFLNTGGVLNYAYAFDLGNNMQLSVGLNVFGFNSEIADDRYNPNPEISIPQLELSKNAFIMQFAPGVRFSVDGFSVGFNAENLFDYNFSTNKSASESDEKIYIGMVDYRLPVTLFSGVDNAYLLPMLYVKSVPYGDTQVGLNALLSSNKFWVQGGYNSFYGISGGLGGRFFKHLSLGVLIEAGLDAEVKDQDPSFEVIAAYTLGSPDARKKVIGFDVDEVPVELGEPAVDIQMEEEAQIAEEDKIKKDLSKAEALAAKNAQKKSRKQKRVRGKKKRALEEELRIAEELAEAKRLKEQQEAEALARAIQMKEQKRLDSIKAIELALAKKIQDDLDMIAARKKAGKAVTQGHYEEVEKLQGQKAGFYLIGNVYGTSRYRDIFVESLKKKGIDAKFFYLESTKWDYVYLERFDTLSEAEKARDNDYNGMYSEKTWIFRIIGE
ncbi:PorP/SprF family type IX secretion system membrane protein [Arenibacter sp. F20364]|uniref:PorP/SprF family type IX secretion system membrane protein n=1 Tax=Arenibacter sp. F20364 TaxID=2926415 RepID=UPI001FF52F77|nr:PorP/SprF family type IX secretion system membrane protein [Arenibacter sp. F20364]MCK0191804.1 PorP/SprF family type IX secretion system membrane protein [Arenibacter sp. F20364]